MTTEDLSLLFDTFDRYRHAQLKPATCRHGEVKKILETLCRDGNGRITLSEAGRSLEGRPIMEVRFGTGPVHLLLWSQMHGDEPTATMALCDLFGFVVHCAPPPEWLEVLLHRVTVHAIPMINPDGAERPHRCTAAWIDMNRDAIALRTPEARLLRDVYTRLRPAFAFNLHDQSVSSVGRAPSVAAIALLAPPPDEARTVTANRLAAMKLGAVIVRALQPFAGGHLAAYDDAYEPRAFGDLLQALGTPTLLIESGQWPGDPEKQFIRKLNFTGLLAAVSAIAEGTVDHTNPADYNALPVNGKMMVDLIVRNVRLQGTNGWSGTVDLAFLRDRTRDGELLLKEVGDVSVYGALHTLDAGGAEVPVSRLRVDEPVEGFPLPGLS